MRYKWLISLAVWLILGVSLYVFAHNPWVDVVWMTASVLIVGATVINFFFDFRQPAGNSKSDAITRGGYPRWFLRFAYDDYKSSRDKSKDEKSSAKKKV